MTEKQLAEIEEAFTRQPTYNDATRLAWYAARIVDGALLLREVRRLRVGIRDVARELWTDCAAEWGPQELTDAADELRQLVIANGEEASSEALDAFYRGDEAQNEEHNDERCGWTGLGTCPVCGHEVGRIL